MTFFNSSIKNSFNNVSIYVLKLESNKFYIGRSFNPTKRISQHFDGEGSFWTKKFKPVKVVEVIDYCDNFDEDKYTLMYMSIYGMDNVRGGAFCSENLSGADKYVLSRMICGATNKCVKCKKPGHYFVDCPENKKNKLKQSKKSNKVISSNSISKETINNSNNSNNSIGSIETNYLSDSSDSSEEEQIWLCDYCDMEFISKDITLNHEKICKNNPKRNKKRKLNDIKSDNSI